jgi:hypothetical protein
LTLIRHKIRPEAQAVSHEALHGMNNEFASGAYGRLREKRAKLDPFQKEHFFEDVRAYEAIEKLSASKLDALIDLLLMDCITVDMQRRTASVSSCD